MRARRLKWTIAGLSLVEISVAMLVLAIALVALVTAFYQAASYQQATRERALAYEAARAKIEEMRSAPFREIYARFNAAPLDDPAGIGTAPGSAFTVEGLTPLPGIPLGEVLFPEAGSPAALCENVERLEFGMPAGRDLNLDGAITDGSRASDYRLLPAIVVVQWQGARGPSRFEMNALFTER